MNKRDLARVLIRVIGVYLIAISVSFIMETVVSIIILYYYYFRPVPISNDLDMLSQRNLLVTSLGKFLHNFFELMVGLFFFFKGGWIANKLLKIDETDNPSDQSA
jgi:hypothetical protein